MDIKKIFEEIGLSDKESAVYGVLLRLGTAKAAQVAQNADLQRTTAYDILRSLTRKGLVTKFIKRSSAFYSPSDPRSLISYLDREEQQYHFQNEKRKKRIEDMLPELVSIAKNRSTVPKVRFFEGKKGLREALEDTLTAKTGILAYANLGTIFEAAPDFFPNYLSKRIKGKIHARAIVPDTKIWREALARSREELREVRFLPPGNIYTPEINIYDDKMLVISWEENIALIVESKELAALQRIVFDNLWRALQKT
jgi:HTH-type transcriptional regulator, sugar sensing transcriptional regulator